MNSVIYFFLIKLMKLHRNLKSKNMSSYGVRILRSGENHKWNMISLGFVVHGNYCPEYTIFDESRQQHEPLEVNNLLSLFGADYPHLRHLSTNIRKGFCLLRNQDKKNKKKQYVEFTANPERESRHTYQPKPNESKLTVKVERQCLNDRWKSLVLSVSVGEHGDKYTAHNDESANNDETNCQTAELKCIKGLTEKSVAHPSSTNY